jgi:hypothetical protein
LEEVALGRLDVHMREFGKHVVLGHGERTLRDVDGSVDEALGWVLFFSTAAKRGGTISPS